MQWLANLSMRWKLFFGFGLMLLSLSAVIGAAYSGITALLNSQNMILQSQKTLFEEDSANVEDNLDLRRNQNALRANLLAMMLTTDRKEQVRLHRDIKDRTSENEETLQRLLTRNQKDLKTLGQLQEFQAVRGDFERTLNMQIIPLIYQGKVAEAKPLALGIQVERLDKMRNIARDLGAAAKAKAQSSIKLSNDRTRQSRDRAQQIVRFVLAVGAVALFLGVTLVISLDRIIANPLKEMMGAAERIAAGDLSIHVSSNHRRDEVGALAQTFGQMTRSLQEMAGAAGQIADGDLCVQIRPRSDKDQLGKAFARMTQSLQSVSGIAGQIASGDLRVQVKPQSEKDQLGNAFAMMVANLQRVTADIAEAATVLGSAASEISASTTQLASSATETATAVTETTATVEEIRQTAHVASQKARQVSDTAQRVVQISQSGRQSTAESTAGMQRIKGQMESIAESMMRLSEQSQAIGAIIATVDDLSQQSNLLAVNASIEAAKAGEQGKGFAVVAQEVKSLADQSKLATTQVRTILSDIQKATGVAVMATEQGGKAVEAGVVQSSQAGESILTLADSVAEASQAATQIAASSQQQLVGIDQVVQAMESIKQAIGQNVDGAKQLETAARNLNALGQRLQQLVEQYKV